MFVIFWDFIENSKSGSLGFHGKFIQIYSVVIDITLTLSWILVVQWFWLYLRANSRFFHKVWICLSICNRDWSQQSCFIGKLVSMINLFWYLTHSHCVSVAFCDSVDQQNCKLLKLQDWSDTVIPHLIITLTGIKCRILVKQLCWNQTNMYRLFWKKDHSWSFLGISHTL